MDLERAREFIRGNHRAVMVTTHPSGRPQLSPVVVGLDAAGRAVISTRKPPGRPATSRGIRECGSA